MSTKLDFLPSGIPIVPVTAAGYAASGNELTALANPRLGRCARPECCLRGNLVPPLLGGAEVMGEAGEIAKRKAQAAKPRKRVFRGTPEDFFGYVFHVEIDGRIAQPPPEVARAMARGTAPEVWERLRPYAEDSTFDGIELPSGLVVFGQAQDEGRYAERLLAIVSAKNAEEVE